MRVGGEAEIEESKSDSNGCASGDNHIYVTQFDVTMARYVHLIHNGVVVNVGDSVTQG